MKVTQLAPRSRSKQRGVLILTLTDDGLITVNMGKARLTRGEVGMTGPQDEKFISQPIRIADVEQLEPPFRWAIPMSSSLSTMWMQYPSKSGGPLFEKHELFPKRTNVHFVQVLSPTHIKQRTWERGAGVTLACGTGACSCAVTAFLNGKTERSVLVSLPGRRS